MPERKFVPRKTVLPPEAQKDLEAIETHSPRIEEEIAAMESMGVNMGKVKEQFELSKAQGKVLLKVFGNPNLK